MCPLIERNQSRAHQVVGWRGLEMRLPPVNNRQVAKQSQEPGIVARRRVSAGDDRLAIFGKQRGKHPRLHRDSGWFQLGRVWDFHMDRTVKTEGPANLPRRGDTRRSGGCSLEEGAI